VRAERFSRYSMRMVSQLMNRFLVALVELIIRDLNSGSFVT